MSATKYCNSWSIVKLLYVLSIFSVIHSVSQEKKYAVVLDAGSTGSRTFIFEFSIDENNKKSLKTFKGKKVEPGLSSFAHNLDDIIEYLFPLIEDSATIIPPEYHSTTQLYVKGTAGMRLLSPKDEAALWQRLYIDLSLHPHFPYQIKQENTGTIEGSDEAFYAVLSSNYIEGSIDAEMIPQVNVSMVGAFDMGGSSTQLIFHKGNHKHNESVKKEDFWSHSWLNFGVERLRDKLYHVLLHMGKTLPVPPTSSLSSSSSSSSSSSPNNNKNNKNNQKTTKYYIENPCTFIGHEHIWNDTHTFIGTGNSYECVDILKKLIYVHETSSLDAVLSYFNEDDNLISDSTPTNSENIDNSSNNDSSSNSNGVCMNTAIDSPDCIENTLITQEITNILESEKKKYVGGREHPPLQGNFYGMSVYFYALDCIRHLGPIQIPDWPTPRIKDLVEATHAFCQTEWDHVITNYYDQHRYTKNIQLPHRCVEALYVLTLLEDGFGLHNAQQNITLALDVKGMEVEWTLGFAISEILPNIF